MRRGLWQPLTGSRPTFNPFGRTDDMRAAVEHIQRRYPNAPLFMIGTSAGGCLATRYLGDYGAGGCRSGRGVSSGGSTKAGGSAAGSGPKLPKPLRLSRTGITAAACISPTLDIEMDPQHVHGGFFDSRILSGLHRVYLDPHKETILQGGEKDASCPQSLAHSLDRVLAADSLADFQVPSRSPSSSGLTLCLPVSTNTSRLSSSRSAATATRMISTPK